MQWLTLGILALAFLGIGWSAARSRRLFEIRVKDGRIASARGRAPGELLHDLEDALGRGRATGTITVKVESGAARVTVAGGIDEATTQRVRNVVGRFTLARLRGAPPIAR